MTEKQIIETLMLKTEEARTAQTYYFKNRNDVNLRASKGKEAALDAYLKELKRIGYNPENVKTKTEQKNIF